MASKRKDRNYTVGYGKPPTDTQFKPGQSGNPPGRRKRSQEAADLFGAIITKPISVNENGRRRSMTKLEGTFTQTVNKALAGDPRSMQVLMQMLKMFGLLDPARTSKPLIIKANIPLPFHLRTADDIKRFNEQDWRQDRMSDNDDDDE